MLQICKVFIHTPNSDIRVGFKALALPCATFGAAILDDYVICTKMTKMFKCTVALLQLQNCRGLDFGADVSLFCTHNSRPPCWCYPSSRNLGMVLKDYVP